METYEERQIESLKGVIEALREENVYLREMVQELNLKIAWMDVELKAREQADEPV